MAKKPVGTNPRQTVIRALTSRLPDAIHLRLSAKQAHWNVRGPNFIGLHELFDKVADAADQAADLIAERLMQLDQYADGTLARVARDTTLAAYPDSLSRQNDHVNAITALLRAFGDSCRVGIDETAAAGDAASADILTQIVRDIDKLTWMVSSHLLT